jgi:CheY-like chemotaxis protein
MKNKTILVVDDETGFLQITQIILQRAGYEPLLASNADEAQQVINQHAPDVIIMDDDMPGMSGGELCYRLKQNPTTSFMRIVMFSANERIQNPDYLARIGADDAIRKPCMPTDILKAVESAWAVQASV